MLKKFFHYVLLCLALLPAAQAAESLVLGVVPYLSARKLAMLYEPMRLELQQLSKKPVTLESAADYRMFLERTKQGRYDIIATSPYFGRLAQQEQNYVPLARPLTDLEPILVTTPDGIKNIKQLQGKTISTSDRMANLTLAAHRYLVQAGFAPGKNIIIHPTGSHANSLASLLGGESQAAIISVSALHQFGPEMAGKVRILAKMPSGTPLLYLGHKRLGHTLLAQLQKGMINFANNTTEGKAFSSELKHDGLKTVSEQDMKVLDPFVKDLKGMLK